MMPAYSAAMATDLNSSQLFDELARLRADAVRLGVLWVEKDAIFKAKRETLMSKLAIIQGNFMVDLGHKISEARITALGSKEYIEEIQAMVAAERESELVKVEYKAAMKSIEAITAIAYVRNNELKLAR